MVTPVILARLSESLFQRRGWDLAQRGALRSVVGTETDTQINLTDRPPGRRGLCAEHQLVGSSGKAQLTLSPPAPVAASARGLVASQAEGREHAARFYKDAFRAESF